MSNLFRAAFLGALVVAAPLGAAAQTFETGPAGVTPQSVKLSGLTPGAEVQVTAERRFGAEDRIYRSSATFKADASGRLDLSTAPAAAGSYQGVDAAGLFWSMAATGDAAPADWRSAEVRLAAAVAGKPAATTTVTLSGAGPKVTTSDIPGFPAAVLFNVADGKKKPVIVVLHGAEGGTRAGWRFGPRLAAMGYVVVGLPYYSADWGQGPKEIPALPGSFIDIRIDQLAELRTALATRPEADVSRFGLFAGSKGSEFALIAASKYPWISSVVAYTPSDVVWEGWGLETIEAEGTRSSFSYQGKALPFMPYKGFVDALLAGPGADLRKVHDDGRALHPDREAAARIPVEDIKGAVMVIAGDRDGLWASGPMGRNIVASRTKAGLKTTALIYPEAGHDLAGDGWSPTTDIARTGGTAAANARAQLDAWPQVEAFLKATLKP